MPLKGVRFRTIKTSKGPVRLAFKGKEKVVEAKKRRTVATQFAQSRKKRKRLSDTGTFKA